MPDRRGTAIERAVPQTVDVARTLPSPTLYALERAGGIAREVLDSRIVAWTTDGWSQRRIAEEIGCSQSQVSRRQQRLGVTAAGPQAGQTARAPRELPSGNDAPRIIEPEILPPLAPDSNGAARAVEQAALDNAIQRANEESDVHEASQFDGHLLRASMELETAARLVTQHGAVIAGGDWDHIRDVADRTRRCLDTVSAAIAERVNERRLEGRS